MGMEGEGYWLGGINPLGLTVPTIIKQHKEV